LAKREKEKPDCRQQKTVIKWQLQGCASTFVAAKAAAANGLVTHTDPHKHKHTHMRENWGENCRKNCNSRGQGKRSRQVRTRPEMLSWDFFSTGKMVQDAEQGQWRGERGFVWGRGAGLFSFWGQGADNVICFRLRALCTCPTFCGQVRESGERRPLELPLFPVFFAFSTLVAPAPAATYNLHPAMPHLRWKLKPNFN